MVHDPELLKCIFVKNYHDFPDRRVSTFKDIFKKCLEEVRTYWARTCTVQMLNKDILNKIHSFDTYAVLYGC